MAKFAITLCVVLFASVANTFIISNNIHKMLIDMATVIKSMEAQMIKNSGDDNIEKLKKVASDLLSNYYETLKTEFITDTMPCNYVFNDPKTYGTECDLSCIDSLAIYSSTMVNMSTCTSTNFPSLAYYKTEINNSTIITIAALMQPKTKILDKGLLSRLFKPMDFINSFNHELQSCIDNFEQKITEIVNAANRSVNKTVTVCLNEKFKHFRNEFTKQIDKVKKCRTHSTKSLNEIISAEVNGTRTELTKIKNNTITEYIAIIEEWAKDYNQVANLFIISNNKVETLKDVAMNKTSIEVQMIKNRGDDSIENLKTVASDLLANYSETLKTAFIKDTMPCNDVFNDPKTYGTECDLSCIDSLALYSSTMVNMSTCTSTNSPSLDYYKTEINNRTIIAIAALMQSKTKIRDKGLLSRLFKSTDSINSLKEELQRGIDNLRQSIRKTVVDAYRNVNKTVTDCLNEKFKYFRNELTKQIPKVKECRTNSTKSLNEIISDEVNGTTTKLTKLKIDTMTNYKAIVEAWAQDYHPIRYHKSLELDIKNYNECRVPVMNVQSTLKTLHQPFKKCTKLVEADELSLISQTHASTLENYIRDLNECPNHKSFASIINDARSTECVLQARTNLRSRWEMLRYFIDVRQQDSFACVSERFTELKTTLNAVNNELGPNCSYDRSGIRISIILLEWN